MKYVIYTVNLDLSRDELQTPWDLSTDKKQLIIQMTIIVTVQHLNATPLFLFQK
jgi:hypothetical protein